VNVEDKNIKIKKQEMVAALEGLSSGKRNGIHCG
jgi:hypothetical protein